MRNSSSGRATNTSGAEKEGRATSGGHTATSTFASGSDNSASMPPGHTSSGSAGGSKVGSGSRLSSGSASAGGHTATSISFTGGHTSTSISFSGGEYPGQTTFIGSVSS